MLHSETFAGSPEIEQLITILTENNQVEFNNRAHTRESTVCPVSIQLQYELARHKAFSRDISVGGISLVGEYSVEVEQIATLTIFRVDDIVTKVRARCVWTKPIGGDYTMSGWKFLRKVLQGDV